VAALSQILEALVLTKVVSRIAAANDAVLNFMGFQPGGFNEQNFGHGRIGSYHVFNNARTIALGRAPGTAAGRSRKQVMIEVAFTYPRMHDSIDLLAEQIHNISKIDNLAARDVAGAQMISRQTRFLGQKAANWRTAMTVGMLRGSLFLQQEDQDWYWTYTSGTPSAAVTVAEVNFRMPAGNKDQLNMTDRAGNSIFSGNIIDVSWDNASANIPLHIKKINEARENVGIGPLTDIHLGSSLWDNVSQNDAVSSQAGIANPPFTTFEREVGTRPDGSPMQEMIGRINSAPGLDWHISDAGLELGTPGSETFTKHWPTESAIFMGTPRATDNFSMLLGSEPIAEFDGGPEVLKTGLNSWSVKRSDPTLTQLMALDNALAVNHDPFSIAHGTVVFSG
jgi:hypothetical protein